MAAEAVLAVVTSKLADLLTEEAKFLRGLEGQVRWVKKELETMHCFLRDAAQKQEVNERAEDLVRSIRDVAYDAEDIVEDFILRKEQERRRRRRALKKYACFFTDLVRSHKFVREISRIKTRVEEIALSCSVHGVTLGDPEGPPGSSNGRLQEIRRFHYSNESDVIGLDDQAKSLESQLLGDEPNRRVISIAGMGGVGKTTLARKIYRSKAVMGGFHHRAWIFVSQTYTAKGLLEDIWRNLMKPVEDNLNPEQMVESLSEFLEDKKYLIALDDVWDVGAWRCVETAFPDNRIGGRILLTTRNKEVALEADPRSSPYELKPLNDENSWALFLKKVRAEESHCSPTMVELGKQIVKKCRGLPLAIVLLGGLLSTKELNYEQWSRLFDCFSWQLKQDQTPCSKILDLSYNDLPRYLKPCFLYFGIFPEDYEIRTRRLIGLWLAEGLVRKRDDLTLEDIAEKYIEELTDRSIVQVTKRRVDGKIKACQMHDLVRELAVSKARGAKFFHTNEDIESSPADEVKIRRYVAHGACNFPPSINNLRSCLVFEETGDKPSRGDGVVHFLESGIKKKSFGLLRVIDLEGVNLSFLSVALEQLSQLRYMGLRHSYGFRFLVSLGNLRNLQTLDVRKSRVDIRTQPIWQWLQLRHLYLDGEVGSNILHPPASSRISLNLENLRTLCGLYIDRETWIEDGLQKSIQLKKLSLYGNLASQGESLTLWIAKLDRLEILSLRAFKGYDLHSSPGNLPRLGHFSNNKLLYRLRLEGKFADKLLEAREFPPNLTSLTLQYCELKEDPMPILEKLHGLRSLELLAHTYFGKEMVCSSGKFRQLEILKICGMNDLESWKVDEGGMKSLKVLHMEYCPNLKMIPHGLQHIRTLEDLKLALMPEQVITRLQKPDGADWNKIKHVSSIIM